MTWILIQIPYHLSRFYLFSMLEHDMDFVQVQVMEFPWHLPRKWWGFHRIWSHFRTKPNCRQKNMRKSPSHFLQGIYHNHMHESMESHLNKKTHKVSIFIRTPLNFCTAMRNLWSKRGCKDNSMEKCKIYRVNHSYELL